MKEPARQVRPTLRVGSNIVVGAHTPNKLNNLYEGYADAKFTEFDVETGQFISNGTLYIKGTN